MKLRQFSLHSVYPFNPCYLHYLFGFKCMAIKRFRCQLKPTYLCSEEVLKKIDKLSCYVNSSNHLMDRSKLIGICDVNINM